MIPLQNIAMYWYSESKLMLNKECGYWMSTAIRGCIQNKSQPWSSLNHVYFRTRLNTTPHQHNDISLKIKRAESRFLTRTIQRKCNKVSFWARDWCSSGKVAVAWHVSSINSPPHRHIIVASTFTSPSKPKHINITRMASNPPPSNSQPAMSSTTKAPSTLSEKFSAATAKAKEYASFWAKHVKKGEMPWTHWYCCQSAGGKEVSFNLLQGRS